MEDENWGELEKESRLLQRIAMSEAAQELEDFHRAKYTLLDAAGNLMDLALRMIEKKTDNDSVV